MTQNQPKPNTINTTNKETKEKHKRPFHITTALHDSRTSQRMIDHQVRERRFEGRMPDPEVIPFTPKEEVIIAQIVLDIVKEDKLNVMAFNLYYDHMHLLLVCEFEEISKIMQKIKSKTARAVNIYRGITIPANIATREHTPLTNALARGKKQNSFWTQKHGCSHIHTEEYLWNAVNYIEKNKAKHNLPHNNEMQNLIYRMVCSFQHAFQTEYK